jgi:histone-lysine N-methyltransferase SETD1
MPPIEIVESFTPDDIERSRLLLTSLDAEDAQNMRTLLDFNVPTREFMSSRPWAASLLRGTLQVPVSVPAVASRTRKAETARPTEPLCSRTLSYSAIKKSREKRQPDTAAVVADADAPAKERTKALVKQVSRTNRLNQRRLVQAIEEEFVGLDMQFNHLVVRKRNLRFGRSKIHDWGLFSLEDIPADTMVIEYIGEVVRQIVADERERRYTKLGMGSSYLFRIDELNIVDATRAGAIARFMNHSCEVRARVYPSLVSIHLSMLLPQSR